MATFSSFLNLLSIAKKTNKKNNKLAHNKNITSNEQKISYIQA